MINFSESCNAKHNHFLSVFERDSQLQIENENLVFLGKLFLNGNVYLMEKILN